MNSPSSFRSDLRGLYHMLGYEFVDSRLLDQALTPSLKRRELLEFIGDRALKTALDLILRRKYPLADEAALSRMVSYCEENDTLAHIAIRLDVSPWLRLRPSTKLTSRDMLADTMEAVLGAIYSDSDLPRFVHVVDRLFRTNYILAPIAKPHKALLDKLHQLNPSARLHVEQRETKDRFGHRLWHVNLQIGRRTIAPAGEAYDAEQAQSNAAAIAMLMPRLEERLQGRLTDDNMPSPAKWYIRPIKGVLPRGPLSNYSTAQIMSELSRS